jgi:acetyl esterase/lipase
LDREALAERRGKGNAMKSWIALPCLLFVCAGLQAKNVVWQPSAGHTQIPIWPGTPPDAQPVPGPETMTLQKAHLVAGRPWLAVTNVSRPTITIYPSKDKNTGTAVVVFPGGGFEVLAMDLEGTEACDWLTSQGITCVLLKYRVPSVPFDWHCQCRPDVFALPVPALEDAQRAIRLVRFHAAEWHIDAHKVGVLGFSAGGYLVAETSTNFERRLHAPVDAAGKESARPDFAMAIYPGHLATDDDKLNQNVPVSRRTPPTFLVQAEDDYTDGVNQSLVYYPALAKAGVPAERHLYAHGGHAFGLRVTSFPITRWPGLAETWLRTIGMIPN